MKRTATRRAAMFVTALVSFFEADLRPMRADDPETPSYEEILSCIELEDFNLGERVGVPWLAWTCGECRYCRTGRENLCDGARFTGYQVDGALMAMEAIKLITGMVRPYSWDGMGGPGRIEYYDIGSALVVNQVADVAEEANHHPDILVHGYKHVRLTLSTHSAGRVTDADHHLARRIDALA